jgi:hypothetical protein
MVAIAANRTVGQDASPPKKAETGAGTLRPRSEAVARLLKTQLRAAQQAYSGAMETIAVQRIGGLLVQVKGDTTARPDLVYLWSVRWLRAQYELSDTREEKIAAGADHQKRMKQLREAVRTIVGDGGGGILQAADNPAAEWYLAEADLWLLKEQAK